MKIYFTAAIIFNDTKKNIYNTISNYITDNNHDLLTYSMNQDVSKIKKQSDQIFQDYYKGVKKWIIEADVVIAEASFPSTIHIGHEISMGLERKKPVIVLYEKNHEPFFLKGIISDKLFLVEYTKKNIDKVLTEYIEYAKEESDIRFNLMLPPRLSIFLNEYSKSENTSKAAIIRNLINKLQKDNPNI